jgi:epoxyqueuosine reductase
MVSIQHLSDLQEGIEGSYAQGLLDHEFYLERLAGFEFKPPASLPEAKSLIVIAVPRPQCKVVFNWHGNALSLILPPTYAGYDETRKQVEELLTALLVPHGYRVARVTLSMKLLAVRSGLGFYGRNNICYVPAMGSFHQLVAVCSDIPCSEDDWHDALMMERCQNCIACLHHCPTGAIAADRFLLHAERCVVFHNEKAGNVPFPAWIDPSWHNCLVGCLVCQRVCPQNKGFLDWVEGTEVFSQEETALILEGACLNRLSAETLHKLERLDLAESLDALPRNLEFSSRGKAAKQHCRSARA